MKFFKLSETRDNTPDWLEGSCKTEIPVQPIGWITFICCAKYGESSTLKVEWRAWRLYSSDQCTSSQVPPEMWSRSNALCLLRSTRFPFSRRCLRQDENYSVVSFNPLRVYSHLTYHNCASYWLPCSQSRLSCLLNSTSRICCSFRYRKAGSFHYHFDFNSKSGSRYPNKAKFRTTGIVHYQEKCRSSQDDKFQI